jgi:hypothetical protein
MNRSLKQRLGLAFLVVETLMLTLVVDGRPRAAADEKVKWTCELYSDSAIRHVGKGDTLPEAYADAQERCAKREPSIDWCQQVESCYQR